MIANIEPEINTKGVKSFEISIKYVIQHQRHEEYVILNDILKNGKNVAINDKRSANHASPQTQTKL